MMLRLSKYDPMFRTPDGIYHREDWTSYSDIGKQFADGELTLESYLIVENMYIDAIVCFFKTAELSRLIIDEVEFHISQPNCVGLDIGALSLNVGDSIELGQIDLVVRLCLREGAWCILSGSNHSYLHFGYDYYVYLGASHKQLDQWNPPMGLFAEVYASPYANE